jgi:hypothetical protein
VDGMLVIRNNSIIGSKILEEDQVRDEVWAAWAGRSANKWNQKVRFKLGTINKAEYGLTHIPWWPV